ncbi:lytic transglycosylase domain-containing protein [Aliiroseovarius subalbicans]|uniref:lytic transglycosylase domain-containing protein n=1 Tax=Aliiroseovarius subalbicans TaxID=2925840 RepID=UPI001F58E165|nr:lytic transglycosylase domain-containing protein [Aliiroseovarius subalbicans]MCI2397969.1 lytic transglycosylase domain-containing protein [Aliiroseovarius subalbicans]
MRRLLYTYIATALIAPVPALAEGPKPFADFTFRRVTVPKPGAGPRIDVQIDPAEQAAALAVPEKAPDSDASPGLPSPSGYEWFWTSVRPEADKGGPANLARAMAALDGKDGLAQPRLQHLQDIAQAHGLDILRATVGTDISPALVIALISVESGGRVVAESGAGAQGLMQLIPATAERFGVSDSLDASQNIVGGVKYLAWLMKHFERDAILTLAGYNAGEGAVRDHGGVPPYAETRAYVPKVLAAWRVARGLCLTPPQLITDGCVFAVKGTSSNG